MCHSLLNILLHLLFAVAAEHNHTAIGQREHLTGRPGRGAWGVGSFHFYKVALKKNLCEMELRMKMAKATAMVTAKVTATKKAKATAEAMADSTSFVENCTYLNQQSRVFSRLLSPGRRNRDR